jgi:hypothetical protein
LTVQPLAHPHIRQPPVAILQHRRSGRQRLLPVAKDRLHRVSAIFFTAICVTPLTDITADVPHVFQAFAGVVDEADEALDRAALFLTQHVRIPETAAASAW